MIVLGAVASAGHAFSALTLLVGRHEGHLACKIRVVGCMVICLELGADLHMAQLMILTLTASCYSKIQTGSPRKRAVKWVCVWHQLNHMQTICTSLQTDNHTNTSSLNFYRSHALPDAQPTVSKH